MRFAADILDLNASRLCVGLVPPNMSNKHFVPVFVPVPVDGQALVGLLGSDGM
jgi:hypothetical protein